MEHELTPDASELGLRAMLLAMMEVDAQIHEFGRGEMDSPFVIHVPPRPTFVVVDRTRMALGPRLVVARSA